MNTVAIQDIQADSLNIYQRINAVMQEVDYIQKLDKKVNNQYRFVSHDQVVGALHKVLTKHGIAVIPSILEHTCEGTKTTIKIQVSFVNIDNPADKVETVYFGYGIDGGDKGIGKAVSYAVKYALLKTFCLETGDDPDYEPEANTKDAQEERNKKDEALLTKTKVEEILKPYANEREMVEDYLSSLLRASSSTYKGLILRIQANPEEFRKKFEEWQQKKLKL